MTTHALSQDLDAYLTSIRFGTLAYVREDGVPLQRRFGSFVKEGTTIYFSTRIGAAKVRELARNPRASFLLEAEGQKVGEWKSALYIGRATLLEPGAELTRAVDLLGARNPRFKDRIASEGLSNTGVFALRADEVEVLDYSKGFGHTERITLARDEQV